MRASSLGVQRGIGLALLVAFGMTARAGVVRADNPIVQTMEA